MERLKSVSDRLFPKNTKRRHVIKYMFELLCKRKLNISYYFTIRTKKDKPVISVCIPVYDRTDMLKESIESILCQTYREFEILLICDGSPSKTLDVVNEYKANPKVRIFKYKDNSGNPVRGRNKGIREAKGKYIAFQDSDDIAEPSRLQISLKYAEEYDADVVYGSWKVKKEKDSKHDLSDGKVVYSPDCDYNLLKQGNAICQSTAMAKTSALKEAGGIKPEMHYCEDYELWLRLANLGYRFKAIPKVLTNLRLHSNNLEGKFNGEHENYIKKALEEHNILPKLKPSIAFIIPGQGISGGIMVICQHANRLIRKGYDVILINNDVNDPFKLDWFPDLLPEVVPLDKVDQNIDIAIATQWSTAYTVRDFPARRKLYFIQSDETRFYQKNSKESELAQQTYSFDLEPIVIAKWLQKWLHDRFNKSSYYVSNGIDASLFFPDDPIEPKTDKLRVLLEGPIDIPFKGMEDAFQIVNGMDCEVWCVSSSGHPKPGWKCDRFFEKVHQKNMRQIYSSCDVLIKMSRIEGFFMPPLEMMACGGTVITGKVTGYDEYIVDGYNGLVVEEGDIAGARNKLSQLINNRDILDKLKIGGLETVKNWSWEYSNDQLERLLSL